MSKVTWIFVSSDTTIEDLTFSLLRDARKHAIAHSLKGILLRNQNDDNSFVETWGQWAMEDAAIKSIEQRISNTSVYNFLNAVHIMNRDIRKQLRKEFKELS